MIAPQKWKWNTAIALAAIFACAYFVAAKESATETLLQGLTFQEIKTGAEKGDPHLQFLLGIIYHDGRGVSKNDTEAAAWLRKAADQGHAQGQYCLGTLYGTGKGTVLNYVEACKWFHLATAQKGPSQQDAVNAFKLLANSMTPGQIAEAKRRAAAFAPLKEIDRRVDSPVSGLDAPKANTEKGDAKTQNSTGMAYEKGKGVAQDYAEAARWYRKAADQGYADAQYNLGFIFFRGNGVKQDYSEAAKWFRKAADQGYDVGQYLLGLLCYNGQGVAQDDVEACKWLDLSIARGRIDLEKQSAKVRNELQHRMTPQQIAEAKRRVTAFVPRKESEK